MIIILCDFDAMARKSYLLKIRRLQALRYHGNNCTINLVDKKNQKDVSSTVLLLRQNIY